MSGGHWNHQNREIEDIADKCDYLKDILYKVSETAHILKILKRFSLKKKFQE